MDKYIHSQPQEIHVASWSLHGPSDQHPPTQVHIILTLNGANLTIRIKTKQACDELINALLSHRQEVWGNEPS